MTKNHRNVRSRCLVHEFSFTDNFNDINHGYRAAILKKNSLWPLPFYMVVVTYVCYEKVRRTMRSAIVSNLLKVLYHVSTISDEFFRWKNSLVYFKIFLKHADVFFHSSETFWPAQKLSYHELVCPGRMQNLGEILLPFLWRLFCESFCFFFVVFTLKLRNKVCNGA